MHGYASNFASRSSSGPQSMSGYRSNKTAEGCDIRAVTKNDWDKGAIENVEQFIGLKKLPIVVVGYPNKGPYMFREPKGMINTMTFNKEVPKIITACGYESAKPLVEHRYSERRNVGENRYYVSNKNNGNSNDYAGMTLSELSNYLENVNPPEPEVLQKLRELPNHLQEKKWKQPYPDNIVGLVVIPEGQIDFVTKTPMPAGLAYQVGLKKKSMFGGEKRKTKKSRKSRKYRKKTSRHRV